MRIALLCFLLCASAAHAQMFKCVLPGGKVEYRGSACDDARQDKPINGAVSNVPAIPLERATTRQPEATAPSRTVIGGEKPGIPSERDIKNMETSASSISLSKREKLIRQAQIDAAKRLRAGGSGAVDYSTVEAEDRRAAARQQADDEAKAARRAQAAATAAAAQQAAMQPSNDRLTQCIGNSCSSSSGENYNAVPGLPGQFRRSSDGKGCTATAGGQISCW
jgi:hypothetical protein